MATLSAYHPQYKKYLPMKVTKIKNPSKWFRITGDENTLKHKQAPGWYWPRFKVWIPQKGYNVDFGTVQTVDHPIIMNRELKLVSSVSSAGNFGIYEWKGVPSGKWYAMLLVHNFRRPPKGKVIKAGDPIAYTAPYAKNGFVTPHTHVSFACEGKPIHYSKVIS